MLRSLKPILLATVSLALAACGPQLGPTWVSGLPADSAGLEFLPATAQKGTIFKYYQPKAESAWKGNWTRKLDLTGVSWNDPRTATLIAPDVVVMAAHFSRPSNVPVMFHSKIGKPYERYITAMKALPGSDVAVGKLNLPLPPEVKPYRLASLADAKIGTPVIVTDQTSTLSVHQIEAIHGSFIRFSYNDRLHPIYKRNLIVGDSGSPSFLVKNGELFLLETHTTGGPGAGPFYGSPDLQTAIRTAMVELGR
jgi:hypothetical protein